METLIMRGKPVAGVLREKIAARVACAAAQGSEFTLAIIAVGNDPAAHVYKDSLVRTAQSLEIKTQKFELPETTTEQELLALIGRLNNERNITGILPLMPLPGHLDGDRVGAALNPEKDVDCLSPFNAGEVYLGRSKWAPCTPRACMEVLRYYDIQLQGKRAFILGRSNVVGKPAALLLLKEHATVTICHSRTRDLAAHLREADILVAAVGIPAFVRPEMVSEGIVVVDVGINEVDGKLVGDVAPEVAAKAAAFTPVPGGIGVVSNMMVMERLVR